MFIILWKMKLYLCGRPCIQAFCYVLCNVCSRVWDTRVALSGRLIICLHLYTDKGGICYIVFYKTVRNKDIYIYIN